MSYLKELIKGNAVLPFRAKSGKEDSLRHDLVRFGKMLHAQGFVAATDGNLSVRLDQERVLVTPTCVSKGMMEPQDMVVVDLNGRKLSGGHNPSSEIVMHLTIYRMRPDVGAVVHAHPCTATAFASAGMALDEPLCSEIVITLGSVPLAPYATTGTMALSDSLCPYIPFHDAILMANHGVVAYGEDLCRAYMRMEAVEHYAKIVLATRQLGSARSLDSQELEKLVAVRSQYGKNGH
ncbi:MAG TPA: class II aldolase/adducin family protein [Candidatus Sulfotelmatobacter sp.]|nr:class II aldolase/adducin family protein [Candidatus Sulfotelmatobacter sp.]